MHMQAQCFQEGINMCVFVHTNNHRYLGIFEGFCGMKIEENRGK